jgi:hypothetical protein
MDKIRLKLSGTDGNAYALLGRAKEAARKAKMPTEEWNKIRDEAMSGDYDHLLQTLMKNFDVE